MFAVSAEGTAFTRGDVEIQAFVSRIANEAASRSVVEQDEDVHHFYQFYAIAAERT